MVDRRVYWLHLHARRDRWFWRSDIPLIMGGRCRMWGFGPHALVYVEDRASPRRRAGV